MKKKKLLVALAAFAMGLALTLPAIATVSTDAGFEFADGNLIHNAATDWNDFAPTNWTGTAPYRTTSQSFAGWTLTGLEDAQKSNTDTAFAGGTKQDDDCPTVIGASAPNKDDLKRVYVTSNTVNGDVFLGLAWVRIPQNTTSPSAHIGFEFNQGETACGGSSDGLIERTAGDMLIVYDFEGGSTDSPSITLRRWLTDPTDPDQAAFFTDPAHPCDVDSNSPPCWGDSKNLSSLGFAEAKVNTSTVGPVVDANTPPTPPATASVNSTLGLNEFGEAGINLTDAGVFSPNVCTGFGTTYAVSRSSGNSGTAQMKDLVGPGEINITNCGSVIIRKVTVPSPDPTDTTFNYTTTGGLDPSTFSLKDGEEQDYGNEVQTGSYSVTETDPGPTFALTDIDCSASDLSHGSTVTEDEASLTASFDLNPLDTIDCTYTNTLQVGALKILKQSTKTGNPLVSNAGAEFSYDGSTVIDNGTGDEDLTIGEVCVSGLLPGDYTVNETSPPSGYGGASESDLTATVVVGTNCTDNEPTGSAVVTFTNPPLSDIQVNFRDGGSGETSATISCDNTTGTGDDTAASGWDTSRTVTGVEAPTTVTCTILIDP